MTYEEKDVYARRFEMMPLKFLKCEQFRQFEEKPYLFVSDYGRCVDVSEHAVLLEPISSKSPLAGKYSDFVFRYDNTEPYYDIQELVERVFPEYAGFYNEEMLDMAYQNVFQFSKSPIDKDVLETKDFDRATQVKLDFLDKRRVQLMIAEGMSPKELWEAREC